MKYYEICAFYGRFVITEVDEKEAKAEVKDDLFFDVIERGLNDGLVTQHIVDMLKKICPEKIALLKDKDGNDIIFNGI